jgi:hypothetical protein
MGEEIKCAEIEEGTLIAELLDIMLVGLIRTAEFVGLVYGISSSFQFSLIQRHRASEQVSAKREREISIKFQLNFF